MKNIASGENTLSSVTVPRVLEPGGSTRDFKTQVSGTCSPPSGGNSASSEMVLPENAFASQPSPLRWERFLWKHENLQPMRILVSIALRGRDASCCTVSAELRRGHVWVSIIWAKWIKDHVNLCPPPCWWSRHEAEPVLTRSRMCSLVMTVDVRSARTCGHHLWVRPTNWVLPVF